MDFPIASSMQKQQKEAFGSQRNRNAEICTFVVAFLALFVSTSSLHRASEGNFSSGRKIFFVLTLHFLGISFPGSAHSIQTCRRF